ncbi:MAG: hypothetical protein NC548_05455 [Lachnospiraceae bacterium]|nr:hypothetical protein [Lachnospiraceae bacterium]
MAKPEDVITSAADLMKEAGKSANVIAKIVSPRSITRLAKDSIFQFPSYISDDIPPEEVFDIAKCLERNYAAIMASVLSLHSYIDLSKYGSIVQYLRSFHSNSNKGGTIDFSTESVIPELVGASIVTENVIAGDVESLWDSVIECLDTSSLNEKYLPYKRTERILTQAMEAGNTHTDIKIGGVTFHDVGDLGNDNAKNPMTINGPTSRDGHTAVKMKDSDKAVNAVVEDRGIANMTPTLVNLQFVVDATGKGAVWKQAIVIGVKSMVRRVRSSVMVSNMIEATMDRPIFRFIKFTKGEINAAELLTNMDVIKDEAIAKAKGNNWLKILRDKARQAKLKRFVGKQLLPNASIVITDKERMEIETKTHIDLLDPGVVTKIISKYFLLNFAVYDMGSRVINIISDGENAYSSYSLRSLVAQNRKDEDILNRTGY